MKIGLIAWERFSYGGVSRIISSVVNELLLHNEVELKILCLKEKNFFQNVYGIDVNRVDFTFMELSNTQKARREVVNRLYETVVKTRSKKLLYYYPYMKYASSYLNKMASWINRNEFDIVMFSSGFEDCIQLAIIKERISPHVKLIGWSHASFKDYFREDRRWCSEGNKRLWSHYYKNFDAIVVLSDADVEYCKQYLGLDAVRIYNSNSFSPRSRSTLNHKKFVYVGSLSENKGFDLMVDAFVEFAKVNNDWSIDVYGEGPGRDYVNNAILKNNLKHRMCLYKYTKDVESIYYNHDVLIFPSRYEGFGIVQIEAASCGLPVIAAELPVTKELMGKYHYGGLFTRNDVKSLTATMLSFTTKDLQVYSDNGVKAAKDFKIEKIAQEWLTLFKSICTER